MPTCNINLLTFDIFMSTCKKNACLWNACLIPIFGKQYKVEVKSYKLPLYKVYQMVDMSSIEILEGLVQIT